MERINYNDLDDSNSRDHVTDSSCCCCGWMLSSGGTDQRVSFGGYDNQSMTSLELQNQQPTAEHQSVVDSAWLALQKHMTSLAATDDGGATVGNSSSQERLGRVQFSVWYDFTASTLTLKIIQATELPAKDKNGTSDPYAKVVLLPDKDNKLTTHVKRKTLAPRWNEVFAFEGYPFEKVINSTLCLQVLDHDRFSKDDVIGEVILPMTSFDLANGQTLWKNLQPSQRRIGRLGELCLSICFDSNTNELTVTVVRARNLKSKDLNGLSDPYVKIWLIQNGRRIEKKKTTTRERTLNPVFEETVCFNVGLEQIRSTSLDVTVMDFDRIGRNDPIGCILLGSKSGPAEVKHWTEMFTKVRTPVTQWHVLKQSTR